MIKFTPRKPARSRTEALVNTVNTVGVMGKGIALMFKEAFPENFVAYAAACKRKEIQVGRMFVTERHDLMGPRWIINFPTKQHWRHPSKMEWIRDGLKDLVRVIKDMGSNQSRFRLLVAETAVWNGSLLSERSRPPFPICKAFG